MSFKWDNSCSPTRKYVYVYIPIHRETLKIMERKQHVCISVYLLATYACGSADICYRPQRICVFGFKRRGEIFNNFLIPNFLRSETVNELWKSFNKWIKWPRQYVIASVGLNNKFSNLMMAMTPALFDMSVIMSKSAGKSDCWRRSLRCDTPNDGSLLVLAASVLEPDPDHAGTKSGHFHQLVPGSGIRSRRHGVTGAQHAQLVLG